MRTAAVLPIKAFARAKSRLGARADRRDLAAAMAADVLDALQQVEGLDEILVVARERPAAGTWVREEHEAGHVAAALLGIEAARGFARVLLVPGDCPALDPAEVGALLARDVAEGMSLRVPGRRSRSVTIVPDRHGTGTNALLLAPPGAIVPAFGPGSFARHAALARAAGAAVRVASPPSLLMDVDTPEDLDVLLRSGSAAPRTRALLARAAA